MNKIFTTASLPRGAVLIIALMAANFINFVFNAFLGRVLTLEQYGGLALINTLWFLLSIFINSLASTTNHFAAYHVDQKSSRAFLLYQSISKKSFTVSLIITALWLISIPLMVGVFNVSSWYMLLSITPVISLGALVAVSRGYLQGVFMFHTVATLIVTESISKLIYAVIFVLLGFSAFAYLSIPLSILTAFVVTYVLSPDKEIIGRKASNSIPFPTKFYFSSVLGSIASAAFLSIDILIAKHYLSPTDAGIYALLSLVGKMIYFFGSLFNSLIITYVSRDVGNKLDVRTTFYKMISLASAMTFAAYMALGAFGHVTVPLLLGERGTLILPYLPLYAFGIGVFTITGVVISFHLSNRRFIFSYIAMISTASMILGSVFFHDSVLSIVHVIFVGAGINFFIVMIIHMYYMHWRKVIVPKKRPDPILPEYKKTLPLAVTVCIPAYNEEYTIGKLLDGLLAQKTQYIAVESIVVVSSASTDGTNDIVLSYTSRDPRIRLIREKSRNGKASAINKCLKQTTHPIVVIQSADTVPDEHTIERLCYPFLTNVHIGMTGGAPVPVNDRNTFIGYIVHTWWWFHRNIPRFGEIIAFRNILKEISPDTAVDEAYIQAKFIQMDYSVIHVDDAVVYNKGATRFSDMFSQRRRIHNGHSRLVHDESIRVSSVSKNTLWLLLFKYDIASVKEFIWLLGGIGIEVAAIFAAQWDKHVGKKNPVAWDIARSTKKFSKKQSKYLQKILT